MQQNYNFLVNYRFHIIIKRALGFWRYFNLDMVMHSAKLCSQFVRCCVLLYFVNIDPIRKSYVTGIEKIMQFPQ